MTGKQVTLNIRIDEKLRAEFKAYTSLNNKTMSEVMIEMIEKYVKENKI